ncbi:MAG: hypothetical protein AAB445_04865 [Patescibacteria group bacterium]
MPDETFTLLEEYGCPTVDQNTHPRLQFGFMRPYLTITSVSLPPTQDEVNLMAELIVELCRRHGGKHGSTKSRDADPLMIEKTSTGWRCRRASVDMWSPEVAYIADLQVQY